MRAQTRIEKALRDKGMKGRIWKGYSAVTLRTGWHCTNGQDWFLGRNAKDAIDTIETLAEMESYG